MQTSRQYKVLKQLYAKLNTSAVQKKYKCKYKTKHVTITYVTVIHIVFIFMHVGRWQIFQIRTVRYAEGL